MKLIAVQSTRTWKAPHWLKINPDSQIYYFYEYRATCQPKRLCRSTDVSVSAGREQAVRAGERIRAQWIGNEFQEKKQSPTIGQLCQSVLEQGRHKFERKKIKQGTWENYGTYLPYIEAVFGRFLPEEMTLQVWNSFCRSFQEKHPGKTLVNHWSFLGMVMNYAFQNGYTQRAWKVENPDPKRKSGRVLAEDELQAVFREASPDLRDQLLFATTMGMRLREHLWLAWEQVDLKTQTVTVLAKNNKNNKTRTIQMSPQVFEMLMRRHVQNRARSPYVFPARHRTDKPTEDNKTAWTAAKRRAGVQGRCRYHDLRHTFVSRCASQVRAGQVSVVLICAYIDMSIRVFEKVYLHLNYQDTAGVAGLIAVKLPETRK